MVSFGWPLALLLLPLPLVLALLRSRSNDNAIAVPPLLAASLAATSANSNPGPSWLIVLLWAAWGLLVGAIAQPYVVTGTAIYPATGRAMVMVIDLSSSMERKDFIIEGKAVDRLTALKPVARAFIEGRKGDRIGLVLFGDEAFSAAPISYDLASISNALEESAIGMAGRATAIGDALGLAIVKLKADPAPQKAIILLSDGTNNSGQAEPEDAAKLAAQFGIRVQTIGMASEGIGSAGMDLSADLDEETLKRVAEASGGHFFRARTSNELQVVYDAIDELETSEGEAPPTVPKLDIRNWLLLPLAFLLAIAGFAVGRRRAA